MSKIVQEELDIGRVRLGLRRTPGRGNPVVMLHGATLTGKSWETTPDGRMGWDD